MKERNSEASSYFHYGDNKILREKKKTWRIALFSFSRFFLYTTEVTFGGQSLSILSDGSD